MSVLFKDFKTTSEQFVVSTIYKGKLWGNLSSPYHFQLTLKLDNEDLKEINMGKNLGGEIHLWILVVIILEELTKMIQEQLQPIDQIYTKCKQQQVMTKSIDSSVDTQQQDIEEIKFDKQAFINQNSIDGYNLLSLALLMKIVNYLLSSINRGRFMHLHYRYEWLDQRQVQR